MVRLMLEQLLFKRQFLVEYFDELNALYNNESFMVIVKDLINSFPVPDCAENINTIKETVSKIFYEQKLKYNYSDLNAIATSVKSKHQAFSSAYISVFFAMWIFILENGPVKDFPECREEDSDLDFRLKYEAKWRCEDGHYVRSKNEMLVDNWLYSHNICHAYEKSVNTDFGVTYYSDFYIPAKKLYIEIWGLKNSEYEKKKEKKKKVYAEKGYKLLDMDEKMLQTLDDVLGKILG